MAYSLKPSATHVSSVPAPHLKSRSLLALDGMALSQTLLSEAENTCLQVADRVDILLVNAPKPPASMLSSLLIRLEESGIDYRLTSVTGRLADQVSQYLRTFAGITSIIVSTLPALGETWRTRVADLRYRGYRLLPLRT